MGQSADCRVRSLLKNGKVCVRVLIAFDIPAQIVLEKDKQKQYLTIASHVLFIMLISSRYISVSKRHTVDQLDILDARRLRLLLRSTQMLSQRFSHKF